MPIRGWSPKHGQPGRFGSPLRPSNVASIWYSVQRPVGSEFGFTAMSMRPSVNVSLRNAIVANQVCVAGSYQHRGSVVNSLAPSLNRSLTLNGPRIDCPFVRKMRYAELTGSRMKPAPAHSPWSGGSNFWLKFVTSLSRLLVPLKLVSSALAAAVALPAAAGAVGTAADATPRAVLVLGSSRLPRGRADEATVADAPGRAGWMLRGTRCARPG